MFRRSITKNKLTFRKEIQLNYVIIFSISFLGLRDWLPWIQQQSGYPSIEEERKQKT